MPRPATKLLDAATRAMLEAARDMAEPSSLARARVLHGLELSLGREARTRGLRARHPQLVEDGVLDASDGKVDAREQDSNADEDHQ
jgi:hypothetical protein